MGAASAFDSIVRACLAHYEANRPGILAGEDPEFLHQGRVALRRLRTALGLFASLLEDRPRRRARRALRRLLRRFGPAREWDVFIEFTLAPAMAESPEDPELRALRQRCNREHRRSVDRARRAAGAYPASRVEEYLSGLKAEGKAARHPARALARKVLSQSARRVHHWGKRIAGLDAEGLHRLRLAVKRLRYALHYFAPLLPKRRVAPMRDALESLQSALGGANDCAVADELLRRLGVGPGAEIARRNRRKLAVHRRELRAAWKDFRGAEKDWE